jgi:epoxyqueuosine reductase
MTPQEKIKAYLQNKGIQAVGFSSGNPMLDYAFFIEKEHAEKAGYFDIGYNKSLEDKSWYTPKEHLESVQSIITLLLPYSMDFKRGENKPMNSISKASLFQDYHLTMHKDLDDLKAFIELEFQEKSIGFCDTGPLNDKAILLRTGTVQLLRNSLLFHPLFGSRFYIGYLLTTLDCSAVDTPFSESLYHPYCSSCGKCAAACPNQAIVEHGHLETKRCISFLTQSSHWSELDSGLTLAGYVYGCDICQLVCPLNGKDLSRDYTYQALVKEGIELDEIKAMTNKAFKLKYNRTSAGWIGKKRFIRNAEWNLAKR